MKCELKCLNTDNVYLKIWHNSERNYENYWKIKRRLMKTNKTAWFALFWNDNAPQFSGLITKKSIKSINSPESWMVLKSVMDLCVL